MTSLECSHPIDKSLLLARAQTPNSTTPRAFLKWAGSKRYLLPELVAALPETIRTYYEPFFGTGSLFFLLQPEEAQLSDACEPLIKTYLAVRDNAPAVLSNFPATAPNRAIYYEVRSRQRRGRYQRAADFIYLNKTCWNGLYRVNLKGKFNVPFGLNSARKTKIIDSENLLRCSEALGKPGIRILHSDFESVVSNAGAGDLVFLDPPYVTSHNSNGFIEYNETIFSWRDQVRLASLAIDLSKRGAHVIVTNADHPSIRQLYPSFRQLVTHRHSTLASSHTKRRPITELLLISAN